MRFLFLFVLLALSLNSYSENMPSLDLDFGCMDNQQADQFVRDFAIDIRSFGGKELCNNQIDSKKLFNDLQIIKNGKFENQGNSLLIQGFLPINGYYEWLKSETRGIERGNDVPYATAYNSGGYFTMQNGWALLSTLGRVGTVVHEARHTEGYYHIPCTFGPYANSSVNGCDRNYSYGGSHGIEMEYYARVSEMGSNFHPVYKSMARMMAVARANFVFNQNPLKKKTALAILDSLNEIYILKTNEKNEDQLVKRAFINSHAGILKTTSFGASIFDGVKVFAIDIYRDIENGFFRDVSDDYSYYKLIKEDRGQGTTPLIDNEEVDMGQKRYFLYLNQNGEMASYNFPQGKWGRIARTPESLNQNTRFRTTLENGQEGLFLQQNENLYSINPENMNIVKLNSNWNIDSKSVFNWKNETYILDSMGKINGKNTAKSIPGLDSLQIRQVVKFPVYDAFEVEN